MQKIAEKSFVVARIALGSLLVASGVATLLQLAPQPTHEGAAAAFMGGLAAAGYFFPLLKVTEIAVGVALLANRFVPLSLVVLAPITVHIVAFHAALAPAGIAPGLVILAAHLALAYQHGEAFAPLLTARQTRHGVHAPKPAAAPNLPQGALAR